jgi:hypothetical protein
MARPSKGAPGIDVDGLVQRARARLDADGFARVSTLGPAAARTRVADALRAFGFEVTKSTVRRPLRDQLLDAVAGGAFVPFKSITSFVRGGTFTEAKKVTADLGEEGRIVRVLRGDAEVIVPGSTPVYSREDLAARRRALDALRKSIDRAVKRNLTVLRADLLEGVADAFPELARSAAPKAPVRAAPPSDLLFKLLAALDATRDETLGLSFIPRVMNHLLTHVGIDAARSSLLEAAERGLVELRPEGGLNRLSREELELCLPGPHGTRLSWVRKIEGSTP